MVRTLSTDSMSPTELDKRYKIKKIIYQEAVKYIDAGWKPNMAKNKYLRDALAKEYSRRLHLEIQSYPRNRWEKAIGNKKLLDISWRRLEKILDKLKRRRRKHKSRRRKRVKKRRTRRR